MEAFAVTYAAVLAAEIVGDKFMYTTGILATRYRATPMIAGIGLAFMVKMGAAVAIGGTIATLPRPLLAVLTVGGVLWVALKFWRTGERMRRGGTQSSNSEALMVSCASVLFSEWADFGQLTAATMAAQFRAPVVVWLGAVAAMLTKGLLAAAIGAQIRQQLRDRLARPVVVYVSLGLLLLITGFSVAETLLVWP
jgi:Ca2+/H+ antiporter, TMEM165/GDT1 family